MTANEVTELMEYIAQVWPNPDDDWLDILDALLAEIERA